VSKVYTLQVISETVLQAITCTGTDNKNLQQNQSNQHKKNKMQQYTTYIHIHTNVILTNKRRTHTQSNYTNTKLKAWVRWKRSGPILNPRTKTHVRSGPILNPRTKTHINETHMHWSVAIKGNRCKTWPDAQCTLNEIKINDKNSVP